MRFVCSSPPLTTLDSLRVFNHQRPDSKNQTRENTGVIKYVESSACVKRGSFAMVGVTTRRAVVSPVCCLTPAGHSASVSSPSPYKIGFVQYFT